MAATSLSQWINVKHNRRCSIGSGNCFIVTNFTVITVVIDAFHFYDSWKWISMCVSVDYVRFK